MNPSPNSQFRIVGVEDDAPSPPSQQDHAAAVKMIEIALSALWKQATIAVAHCFTLLSAASVFTLFFVAPVDPSVKQLTLLGIYSAFILAANAMVIWSRK
jgi:hypothetical protein